MNLRLLTSAALLPLVLSVAACGDDDSGPGPTDGITDYELVPADPETTRVRVEFTDSSVPPEYHRSWVLLLDRTEISVVVDSYGDVVGEKTAPMPRNVWQEFTEDLPRELSALGDPAEGEECDGGTAISLLVEDAGEAIDREIDVSSCSDGNDEIIDQVIALVEPLSDKVDLPRLIETAK